MKFNFENAKNKAKKVIKETTIGAAAMFGVMNGSAQAQNNESIPVNPEINKETVTKAAVESKIDSETVHFEIEKKKLELDEVNKKLNLLEDNFNSLHALGSSNIKNKKEKENWDNTKNLTQDIKKFIDHYASVKPNSVLTEKISPILADIAHPENKLTSTNYALVQRGINSGILGTQSVRGGVENAANMNIKKTVDDIAFEYTKKLTLEKQIQQLEQAQK